VGQTRIRGIRAILIFAALLGFSRIFAIAQPVTDPPAKYAEAIRQVESLVRSELESKSLPAVSIAIVDDQTVVWAKGFGFVDSAKKRPATAETIYRVGSVSKLFTDIAVMQLVEAGKLELDAPVTKYIPDFRPKGTGGQSITLRQLMAHRAGLVREAPVGNYFDDVNLSLEKMVASLNETSMVFAPGTKPKYSNAGIATVGYVLQATQREQFSKYLRRTLLEPLGMNRSAFEPLPELKKDLAEAIMWTYHGREFPAPTFELGMAPAGSMYTTVNDLAVFLMMLAANGSGRNGRILKPDSLHEMWKPQFAKADAKTGIGLGFFVNERAGLRRIGHNGAIYGFATELAYQPEEKIGVVVAISCDCANPVAARIANTALDCMVAAKTGKPLPKTPETKPVPEETCRAIAGRWRNAKEGPDIEFESWNGKLWLWRGGVRVELRQSGDDLVSDDRLGFGTKIRLESNGVVQIGTDRYVRRDAEIPPEPPEHWRGLIGEYGWDHNVLYIHERHGTLYALIEWFFLYELKEESKDVFAFPNWGLYHDEKLIFERDRNGRATRVVTASVPFVRRSLDGEDGSTFRIKPIRQFPGLLKEALSSSPPEQAGRLRKPELVELTAIEPTLKLDIRYATDNNFLSVPLYSSARAFLQKPAADALVRAHKKLEKDGFGLLIHDGYRPWYVTKMFWEATPEKFRMFVADPTKGSRHNRGCAVDLTLFDRKTGKPIIMPGGYDEFSDRSYPEYPGGTSRQRHLRDLLRRTMESEGFRVYEAEWWHFDYRDWREYPILNRKFEDLK
jgi:serine beta-lactamase-like protein LACTB